MYYLGGKTTIGAELSSFILSRTKKRQTYLEPFIGGAGMFRHMARHFGAVHAGDTHEDLIAMWQAVATGWVPPTEVSEEMYNQVRHSSGPSAIRGFVGFNISFGGKWWGGYARNWTDAREDYAQRASRDIVEASRNMPPNSIGSLQTKSYDLWEPTKFRDCVVYADPPYAGTTEYKGKGFDSRLFWNVMANWADNGVAVFVSEYSAPRGWIPVWSKRHNVRVSGGMGVRTMERLFMREPEYPGYSL